jgi:hypothetical protein
MLQPFFYPFRRREWVKEEAPRIWGPALWARVSSFPIRQRTVISCPGPVYSVFEGAADALLGRAIGPVDAGERRSTAMRMTVFSVIRVRPLPLVLLSRRECSVRAVSWWRRSRVSFRSNPR